MGLTHTCPNYIHTPKSKRELDSYYYFVCVMCSIIVHDCTYIYMYMYILLGATMSLLVISHCSWRSLRRKVMKEDVSHVANVYL